MEHQKGLSNDTTSNASSSRDQESTGFSEHDPMFISSELTTLWSQQQAHNCEYNYQSLNYGTHFNPFLQFPGPPTSPSVMASKLLELHQSGGGGSSSNSSSSSLDSPPAWKKMRPINKHEHVEKPRPVSTVNMGTRELSTMEHLLIQCATSLEANDMTQAQQTIFVINNIASVDGDPNQRLLSHFLKALLSRFEGAALTRQTKLHTILELTTYIDVMPWYRFGFIAANGAILAAMEGKQNVHILDFNTSHCTQWPTFIEALSERAHPPPRLRLTICTSSAPIPPLLGFPYHHLTSRLQTFATSKNITLECNLVDHISEVRITKEESLAVNCLYRLHYVKEKDEVLRFIRGLHPEVVTLTEEDVDLTSSELIPRLRSAFNHLWIPFDALHTLLSEGSRQRLQLEEEMAEKINNVVACEGEDRVERAETKLRWVERMRRAGFAMAAFGEDVVEEDKVMLAEHSGCWGLRKEEDEEVLVLTWKGHNVSFASAWVPHVNVRC